MSSNEDGPGRRPFRPGPVEVLTICSDHRDWMQLRAILSHTNWVLHHAPSVSIATDILRRRAVPVLLCPTRAEDGDWKEILRCVESLPDAPAVIVFTEEADERLWTAILRAGAQDVVTRPFDASDLYEVISLAFRAWSTLPRQAITLALR